MTIEKLEPMPERICYVSADPQIVYNPLAVPFYALAEKATDNHLRLMVQVDRTVGSIDSDRIVSLHTAYEFNLTKAMDDAEGITDPDQQRHMVLTRLAEYCQKTGIPMALARQMAKGKSWLNTDPLLVNKVFENAYRQEQSKQYKQRKERN